MQKTKLSAPPDGIPEEIVRFLGPADYYDSSCSDAARVCFVDRAGGFFLKSAAKGTLAEEARMTDLFFRRGMGPEVLFYRSEDRDWMLTAKIPGEDGTHWLDEPEMLCALLGEVFRSLHDGGGDLTVGSLCPDRTAETLTRAKSGLEKGTFETHLRPERYGIRNPEDARAVLEENGSRFRPDCLIHGDACLPNVLIEDGRFRGFVDCGAAGFGNRHTDLFWTVWSLAYNMKTDRFGDRFLDAYGREAVDPDLLRTAAAAEAVFD